MIPYIEDLCPFLTRILIDAVASPFGVSEGSGGDWGCISQKFVALWIENPLMTRRGDLESGGERY
jgi:hypothetical protein